MALAVEALHHLVVGVLVADEEGAAHRALVRVLVHRVVEEVDVVLVVLTVDGSIQRQNNHLWSLKWYIEDIVIF